MAATRSQVTKLIERVPLDSLRPHANFRQALQASQDRLSARDVGALQALTDDVYRSKYPISDKLRRPVFNPNYYDNVVRAMRGSQEPTGAFHFITKYFRWK